MASTTIDLLRHGEVEGRECFRGHLDDPLSARGWQQMQDALAQAGPWQQIITSPLQRCRLFAEHLALEQALPLESEADFMELDFGQWDGRSTQEIQQTDAQGLQRFWSDPVNHAPPGGESLAQFQRRVLAAWQRLLQRHQDKRILLIAHGGTLRTLLAHVLEMPLSAFFRLEVAHACLSRIHVEGEPPLARLAFHGWSPKP